MPKRKRPPPPPAPPVEPSPVNQAPPEPIPAPASTPTPSARRVTRHTHHHQKLKGAGRRTHFQIDRLLPNLPQKILLLTLAENAPVEITGARDDPEAALANLLTALATLGLITDSTTAS